MPKPRDRYDPESLASFANLFTRRNRHNRRIIIESNDIFLKTLIARRASLA